MDRLPDFAEDRMTKLNSLINARITAIESDILVGRKSTIVAVAERLNGIEAGAEEADVLVRAAVLGNSALVGPRIAEAVSAAIFFEAESLADKDIADIERSRDESSGEDRIAAVECDRLMAMSG
jgi:hypothetical protein